MSLELSLAEKAFADIYFPIINQGGNPSQAIVNSSLTTLLTHPSVSEELACVITMIHERALRQVQWNPEPTAAYFEASERLGKIPGKPNETRIIARIARRVQEAIASNIPEAA